MTTIKDLFRIASLTAVVFTLGACGNTAVRSAEEPVITQELISSKKYPDPAVRDELRAYQLGNVVFEKYIAKEYLLDRNDPKWNLRVAESYNVHTDRTSGRTSCWHYTTVLALSNQLYALSKDGTPGSYANVRSEEYLQLFNDLFAELSWYRGTDDVVGYNGTRKDVRLYAVDRAAARDSASISGIAAVYDDQMWMIREFVDAYRYTGEKKFLEHAEELVLYCLDGWDCSINPATGEEYGGITWGPGYASKHTCSNAPIIKPLAELAGIYKESDPKKAEYYLQWAEKIYNYSLKTFRNPNSVFGDTIWYNREMQGEGMDKKWVTTSLANPMDPTAYTYNTGAMISGAAYLYDMTGETKYLDDAKTFAAASHAFFTIQYGAEYDDMLTYRTNGRVWFNLILLTGYLDLYPHAPEVAPYIETFENSLNYAYENYYCNGILPRNYIEGWNKSAVQNNPDAAKDVMESASNAEMYARLAEYHRSLKNKR